MRSGRRKFQDIIREGGDATILRVLDKSAEMLNHLKEEKTPVGVTGIRSDPFQHTQTVVTENDFILIHCLKLVDGAPTTLGLISRATGISINTLKSSMARLKKKGIISAQKRRVGSRNGFTALIHTNEITITGARKRISKILPKIKPESLTMTHSAHIGPNSKTNARREPALEYLPTEIDLDNYPQLTRIGFSETHIEQIKKAWMQLEIDPSFLPRSLEFAEFALESGSMEKIDNPLAYIVASLKRGQFGKPKGFKSRRERLAEEVNRSLTEEVEKLKKINEEYFEKSFLVWWNGLSEEEKRKIDSLNTAIPNKGFFRELHRKQYFRENVFTPL
ncbi:MAG: hypothetical protein QXZ09_09470 [Candidatus Methanomethylicaceae archaeon]